MRHAFLITAYNNFDNLNRLLGLLDDGRNIIFLHIDAKAGPGAEAAVRSMTAARLVHVPSMNVKWGDVSQIECTLLLLRQALELDWDYCHYITESDMPLKTMDQLDRIFSENQGKQFIDFAPGNYGFAQYKCEVYHIFSKFSAYRTSRLLKGLNHGLARLQWYLGVRRHRRDYKHGSAYFSVTREFAQYLVRHGDEIRRDYRHTIGADEVWLQTLCGQSPFLASVANFEEEHLGNLRYIDWTRREGNSPHTFTDEDWDDLIDKAEHSELCFARKFSRDSTVAKRLAAYLQGRRETR